MLSVAVLFFVFLVTLYLFVFNKSDEKKWKEFFKIPGPKGYPVIGNLFDFLSNNKEQNFKNDRLRALEYYPIYKMNAFNIGNVFLIGPEDIEIVLTSMKHITKNEIYSFFHRWLGTGLLTSTGAKWQTRRKILTPAFHFNILQDFLNIFNEETKNLVECLSKSCNEPFIDVKIPITEYTLTSIAETAMGINLNEAGNAKQEKYKNAVYEFGQISIYRMTHPWMYNSFVYSLSKTNREEIKVVDTLHAFTNSVISSHKKNFQKPEKNVNGSYSMKKKLAMLDLLLTYQNEGADITDEGIREEVDTFMFEGHDTTSVALCFLLMSLANEQSYQEEVYNELVDTLGDKTPDYNDLSQLKFMERCVKESLRLYPSVPVIGRVAGEDVKTHSGYTIPKGTDMIISIYDMHHSSQVYENPEKFDPDRFLPENSKNRHPFSYVPFSAGPRNCIGQKFAMLELKAALCGILRAFKLEAVDTPKDMEYFPDLVLRTNGPIRVKFVKRSK